MCIAKVVQVATRDGGLDQNRTIQSTMTEGRAAETENIASGWSPPRRWILSDAYVRPTAHTHGEQQEFQGQGGEIPNASGRTNDRTSKCLVRITLVRDASGML